MEKKKLYRSSANSMICGVCGGIGEYLGVDPTVIRLIWVIFGLMAGCGILAYIIAAIIMPCHPAPHDPTEGKYTGW